MPDVMLIKAFNRTIADIHLESQIRRPKGSRVIVEIPPTLPPNNSNVVAFLGLASASSGGHDLQSGYARCDFTSSGRISFDSVSRGC